MPTKYSRNDYLAGRITFQDYYNQFVTPEIRKLVLERFGIEKLKAAKDKDEHLNSIPLHQWDQLGHAIGQETANKLKNAGDCLSLAGKVCILKAAAREILQEQETMETYHGFAITELNAAFDLVKNEEHWKNPINSICTSEEVKIIAAAIQFYTATKAKFDYLGVVKKNHGRFKYGDHILRVTADGYRRGPAGDH